MYECGKIRLHRTENCPTIRMNVTCISSGTDKSHHFHSSLTLCSFKMCTNSHVLSGRACTCWRAFHNSSLAKKIFLFDRWCTDKVSLNFRNFPRQMGWSQLLPVLARALAQVRGLGLVQREELLPGQVHGPHQLRHTWRIRTVCCHHEAG